MRIWTKRCFRGALAVLAFMTWSAGHLAAQELDWAKRVGGVQGNDVETDSAGNSYMTGLFEGTATFGAGEPNETTLTSADAPPHQAGRRVDVPGMNKPGLSEGNG